MQVISIPGTILNGLSVALAGGQGALPPNPGKKLA